MSDYEDVKAFHRLFRDPPPAPILLEHDAWSRRIRLILEELAETARAHALMDLEGFADGLVDLSWVVLGTAVEAGLPWERLWIEVRRANMDKKGAEIDRSGKL